MNGITSFEATKRDLDITILSGVSQRDKRQISLRCGILKKNYKLTYIQNRSRPTDIKNLWLPKRKGGRGDIN